VCVCVCVCVCERERERERENSEHVCLWVNVWVHVCMSVRSHNCVNKFVWEVYYEGFSEGEHVHMF